MDLVKQYIVQCIVSAANNLRLSTEKIEVVALLREDIAHTDDLERFICEMKKVTELSTYAIKIGEIYNYLMRGKVDFLKISDKFKEHCSFIVRELNNLLEKISPQNYKQISSQIKEHLLSSNKSEDIAEISSEKKGLIVEEIKEVKKTEVVEQNKIAESEKLKEEFILDFDDKNDEMLFEKFEERILNSIKSVDKFLREISPDKINEEELDKFYAIIQKNAELSSKIGFDIIANMHSIFANALQLIKIKSISPVKEVVEGMRACLIVIVAVVRGKEVDITNYLNRAESFGRIIQDLN